MKKTLIGIGVVGALAFGGTLPVVVESIPARAITISGTGCFELQRDGTVVDITQKEYSDFALPNSRPVIKAWCGSKFETPERQPSTGDYWDVPNGKQALVKGRPVKIEGRIVLDEANSVINITEPLIETLIPTVDAAITYQNSGAQDVGAASSVTTAFDVGSGSNRLLSVDIISFYSVARSDCAAVTVTFNGASLTPTKVQDGYSGTNNITENWYMVAPDTGSHNVITTTGGTCDFLGHMFVALNGASQTAQPDSTNGGLCSTTLATDKCIATSSPIVVKNSWGISAINLEICLDTNSTSSAIHADGGCYGDATNEGNPSGTIQSAGWSDNRANERWAWTFVSYAPVPDASTNQTDYFTKAGTYTWVAPTGVTQVFAACWGGGGGGGDGTTTGGGGGGGGGYSSTTVSVTAGNNYTVVVGPGGTRATTAGNNGFSGATSTFNTSDVIAAPGWGGYGANAANGAGGPGGAVASSTGTTKTKGGNGGASNNTGDTGGGGGGAAGPQGAGANAANAGTVVGSDGGQGDNSSGGAGGGGGSSQNGTYGVFNSLGGGGGGGADDTFAGGNGALRGAGGGGGENNSVDNIGNGGDGACELNYLVVAAAPAATTPMPVLNINGGSLLIKGGTMIVK